MVDLAESPVSSDGGLHGRYEEVRITDRPNPEPRSESGVVVTWWSTYRRWVMVARGP